MLKAPANINSNGLVLKIAQKFLLYPKLVSTIVRYIPIVSQHALLHGSLGSVTGKQQSGLKGGQNQRRAEAWNEVNIKEFSPSLASAPLEMHFAQVYAVTGISPPQLSFDGSAVSSFFEVALTSHSLSDCLPVGLLQAQRSRDASRTLRADPPIWEDTTLHYAAKVLNLASLPQGTRSHYEKLLHERHWTIGHNQCKGARTNESRTQLLTCTLCCSPDSTSEDTYDHVFRLCPHPLL
eukprot:gene20083-23904_t